MLRLILFLFALSISQTLLAQSTGLPHIPVVPVARAKANLEPPLQTTAVEPGTSTPRKAQSPLSAMARSELSMEPGVNEIMQIALGHLNRIVTPFSEPKVTTTSPATTEVRDHVLYIGTTDERPLTLFITEKGSEEQALSLTLIPRKIPPREIYLRLKNSLDVNTVYTRRAEKWEQSQPYINTIETLFKELALGGLPTGYQFRQTAENKPRCRQTGMTFNFETGQIVAGHNLVVHIGLIENTSPEPLEFIEQSCGNWDVAAVSAFPRNALRPGEQTEVYVAIKKRYLEEIKIKRPSLLTGSK